MSLYYERGYHIYLGLKSRSTPCLSLFQANFFTAPTSFYGPRHYWWQFFSVRYTWNTWSNYFKNFLPSTFLSAQDIAAVLWYFAIYKARLICYRCRTIIFKQYACRQLARWLTLQFWDMQWWQTRYSGQFAMRLCGRKESLCFDHRHI